MDKKDFNSESFKKYFTNTSWLLGEKILRMVVGLFVGVWVARYLGPDNFGLFSYAQSFVGLFAAIATFGLDGIIVRELVKDESNRGKLLGTAFGLKFIGGIAALLILAIAVNFTSNDDYTNLLVFIIASAIIFQSFNVIDFYFQAKVLSKYVVYANIISLLLSSIVKIILILNEAPLMAFAWTVLFDSVVLALGFVYFYFQNQLSFKEWKFEKSIVVSLLKDSWPIILSSMVLMIQARIDQVMIKEISSTSEVGYYSVALRFIELFGFIPVVLNNSLFPALVNAKKKSEELYKSRFLNYYRLSFFLFLATAIPIFIFAEQVTVLFYGIKYQPAGALLSLMAFRLFFTNIGVARGSFITIENLFKFSLITMTFGTVVNVVLNYFLIPEFQGQGAIVASIISFFSTIFFIDFIYKKTRPNVILQLKGMATFYKINPGVKID